MKFIRLTYLKTENLYLSVDKISFFSNIWEPTEGGSKSFLFIMGRKEPIFVQESAEEILEMINEVSCVCKNKNKCKSCQFVQELLIEGQLKSLDMKNICN